MSIINLREFKVTAGIAGHALSFLLTKPGPLTVEDRGKETWYIGWGERAVVNNGDDWEIKSWRRYEYTWLNKMRNVSVDVTATIAKFRNTAIRHRKEK